MGKNHYQEPVQRLFYEKSSDGGQAWEVLPNIQAVFDLHWASFYSAAAWGADHVRLKRGELIRLKYCVLRCRWATSQQLLNKLEMNND